MVCDDGSKQVQKNRTFFVQNVLEGTFIVKLMLVIIVAIIIINNLIL